MNCNADRARSLIAVAIALLVVVAAAATTAIFVPWPWDLVAAGVALATAVVASILVGLIQNAITEYIDCRNAAEGPSECPTTALLERTWLIASGTGAIASLVAVLIIGLPQLGVPYIGKLSASPWLVAAAAAAIVAAGLLGNLLSSLNSYEACRNNERTTDDARGRTSRRSRPND
jgi:hypothetical protein